MRIGWMLWLIGIVSCIGCAGAPGVDERPTPHAPVRTVPDILRLFRDLAIKGECSTDEFYSTNVMHRLFGNEVQARRSESDHMLRVSMHGFQQLVRGRKATHQQAGSLDGVWLEARKRKGEAECTLAIDFHGNMRGRDFSSVVRVLGSDWSRDYDAETRRNVNCCLHAWNPKSMSSGRPMGNAIITYPGGQAPLVLVFDDAGDLASINASWTQP